MKIPRIVVPVLIVLAAVAGLVSARLFAIPSVTMEFAQHRESPGTRTESATFIIEGVKCVDTARFAGDTLKKLDGVVRYVAYASYNRAVVEYDPDRVSIDRIREAFEGPIYLEESQEFLFNQYTVLEINGRKMSNQ